LVSGEITIDVTNGVLTIQFNMKGPLKTIIITQHEIFQATRPMIERSKKEYTRKQKHKKKDL